MVMLQVGLNKIRDLVNAEIDYGILGTSSALASELNTGLGTADLLSQAATVNTTSNKSITVEYTLLSTEGATCTYNEFAIFATGTTVPLSRITMTGIAFTTDGTQDIVITYPYYFEGG